MYILAVVQVRNFGISIVVTFSAILRLSHDHSVISGEGTLRTWWKPPPELPSHWQLSYMPFKCVYAYVLIM